MVKPISDSDLNDIDAAVNAALPGDVVLSGEEYLGLRERLRLAEALCDAYILWSTAENRYESRPRFQALEDATEAYRKALRATSGETP